MQTINFSNFIDYTCFDYSSTLSKRDIYKLGDVVINQDNEIGIIIQMHSPNEFRTDMFGNTHIDEVRAASYDEILTFRPNIKKEVIN